MIHLLDCTIRDGGYINNWDFSQNFVESLYRAASESGCEYVEIGFFAPHNTHPAPWRHCTAERVRSLKDAVPAGCGIAVMIDYGSCSLDEIPSPDQYPVDLIRIATPKSERRAATEFAAALGRRGYKTTLNYMGITDYNPAEVLDLVRLIEEHKSDVEYFYVADSFGSLLPSEARQLFQVLRYGTTAALGFHPHNNMGLAFANSLEGIEAGLAIVDGSIFGMGRGAGNLFLEAVLAFLEREAPDKFRLLPVLQFADLFMNAKREQHDWGYSLPQLISGVLACHPNYPTNLLAEKLYTADEIYHLLQRLSADTRARFSPKTLGALKTGYSENELLTARHEIGPDILDLAQKHEEVLLLAGGPSIAKHQEQLEAYVAAHNPAVISINNPGVALTPDALFFANRRRLLQHSGELKAGLPLLFTQSIQQNADVQFKLSKVSWINVASLFEGNSPFETLTPRNSAVEAILALSACGFKRIRLAGLDGFSGSGADYYNEKFDTSIEQEDAEARNAVIEEELAVCAQLAARAGFEFSILTPTRFAQYANLDVLPKAAVS